MIRTNLEFMSVDDDVGVADSSRAASRARARASRVGQPRPSAWRWPARRSSSSTATCAVRACTPTSASTTRSASVTRGDGARRPSARGPRARRARGRQRPCRGRLRRLGQGRRRRAARVSRAARGPLPPNPGEIVNSRRFGQIIKALEKESDLVIVDSPAMLAVGDTAALAAKVDGLVFLVDMHVLKRPLHHCRPSSSFSSCRAGSMGVIAARTEGTRPRRPLRLLRAPYGYYETAADGDGAQPAQRSAPLRRDDAVAGRPSAPRGRAAALRRQRRG